MPVVRAGSQRPIRDLASALFGSVATSIPPVGGATMADTNRPARPDEPIEAELVVEPTAPATAEPALDPDYDEHGVPSLDYVRQKIEGRYATSIGLTELAEDTPEARTEAQQAADREEAARARLEEIRRSLRP
jgi:hypothetical protein